MILNFLNKFEKYLIFTFYFAQNLLLFWNFLRFAGF